LSWFARPKHQAQVQSEPLPRDISSVRSLLIVPFTQKFRDRQADLAAYRLMLQGVLLNCAPEA
jgi:hypothetical protein